MLTTLLCIPCECWFLNFIHLFAQNAFNFEKRDWFSVPVEALPDGSRLVRYSKLIRCYTGLLDFIYSSCFPWKVMGLNPPFGVQASLANKFIDHALKFKPKLLILIVPQETRRYNINRCLHFRNLIPTWFITYSHLCCYNRLDQKRSPYDLIWEEEDMLSGKVSSPQLDYCLRTRGGNFDPL